MPGWSRPRAGPSQSIHHGIGPSVQSNGPAPSGAKIGEGEIGVGGLHGVLAGDRLHVTPGMMIAGQNKVIAVVDIALKTCVPEGPATSAGLGRGLVQVDTQVGPGEPDGGGETGKTGADDMDGTGHARPGESTAPMPEAILAHFDSETRAPRAQERASIRSR